MPSKVYERVSWELPLGPRASFDAHPISALTFHHPLDVDELVLDVNLARVEQLLIQWIDRVAVPQVISIFYEIK